MPYNNNNRRDTKECKPKSPAPDAIKNLPKPILHVCWRHVATLSAKSASLNSPCRMRRARYSSPVPIALGVFHMLSSSESHFYLKTLPLPPSWTPARIIPALDPSTPSRMSRSTCPNSTNHTTKRMKTKPWWQLLMEKRRIVRGNRIHVKRRGYSLHQCSFKSYQKVRTNYACCTTNK